MKAKISSYPNINLGPAFTICQTVIPAAVATPINITVGFHKANLTL